MAISYLRDVDTRILKELSPETLPYKPYLKLPLLLLVVTTASFSSCGIAVIKCATEIIKTDSAISWLSIGLLLLGAGFTAAQFFTYNETLGLYD